jgi:hypothetical protein
MFIWIAKFTLLDTKILLQLQFSRLTNLKDCGVLWWVETFTHSDDIR